MADFKSISETASVIEMYEVVAAKLNDNRPFPSSKKSHFQNEAKCEAIDMKMIFNYYANKTHFHNKGFALSLVLKVRFFGTRKWSIQKLTTATGPPTLRVRRVPVISPLS